jgi:hypothetical protein
MTGSCEHLPDVPSLSYGRPSGFAGNILLIIVVNRNSCIRDELDLFEVGASTYAQNLSQQRPSEMLCSPSPICR